MKLEVRTLPITELQPAEYNPRQPLSAAARKKLRAGIETFGLVEPLVWNETTARLVGGHARLSILKELGFTEVPVSVVHLSEAQERALNILLNNQESQGRYDPAKLAEVLRELHDLPEFTLTGFGESTLKSLELEALPDVETETPEGMVEVILKLSDSDYTTLEPEINNFIRSHTLEAHVRRM